MQCDGAIYGAAYLYDSLAVPTRISWRKVEQKGLGLTQQQPTDHDPEPLFTDGESWQSLAVTLNQRHATTTICKIALHFQYDTGDHLTLISPSWRSYKQPAMPAILRREKGAKQAAALDDGQVSDVDSQQVFMPFHA